jgi:hypothetical protein
MDGQKGAPSDGMGLDDSQGSMKSLLLLFNGLKDALGFLGAVMVGQTDEDDPG